LSSMNCSHGLRCSMFLKSDGHGDMLMNQLLLAYFPPYSLSTSVSTRSTLMSAVQNHQPFLPHFLASAMRVSSQLRYTATLRVFIGEHSMVGHASLVFSVVALRRSQQRIADSLRTKNFHIGHQSE
jgi:hypothetical protein